MIKLITEETFIPNLSQDIHYISWTPYSGRSTSGYSQMAYVDTVVRKNLNKLNIYTKPESFYQQIDEANETGTFYPDINITLMPSAKGVYSDEEIYHHISDAFKAQNKLIHAKTVIFDMRAYSYYDPHTEGYDNAEYLHMIDYLTGRSNHLEDKDVRVYVISSEEIKPSLRGRSVHYAVASEEEIEPFRLNQK